jgi:hypothetical protein
MASEDTPVHRSVTWPTRAQWVRQLSILSGVVVLWGGAFWGAMHLPTAADVEVASGAAARREARRDQAERGPDPAPAEEIAEPAPPADASTANVAAAAPAASEQKGDAPAPAPAPEAVAKQAGAMPTLTVPDRATPAAEPPAATHGAASPPPAAAATDQEDPLAVLMEDAAELGVVSFTQDVLPILDRRCVKCHGGEREEGGQRIEEGLSLLTWEDVMAGSTWGSVVEPGDVAGSYLLELIQNGDMPDKEPRLLPREVRVITQWIATGAKKN